MDDARDIIQASGYGDYLEDTKVIVEDITKDALPEFVRNRMLSISLRGMWYPIWNPTPEPVEDDTEIALAAFAELVPTPPPPKTKKRSRR